MLRDLREMRVELARMFEAQAGGRAKSNGVGGNVNGHMNGVGDVGDELLGGGGGGGGEDGGGGGGGRGGGRQLNGTAGSIASSSNQLPPTPNGRPVASNTSKLGKDGDEEEEEKGEKAWEAFRALQQVNADRKRATQRKEDKTQEVVVQNDFLHRRRRSSSTTSLPTKTSSPSVVDARNQAVLSKLLDHFSEVSGLLVYLMDKGNCTDSKVAVQPYDQEIELLGDVLRTLFPI